MGASQSAWRWVHARRAHLDAQTAQLAETKRKGRGVKAVVEFALGNRFGARRYVDGQVDELRAREQPRARGAGRTATTPKSATNAASTLCARTAPLPRCVRPAIAEPNQPTRNAATENASATGYAVSAFADVTCANSSWKKPWPSSTRASNTMAARVNQHACNARANCIAPPMPKRMLPAAASLETNRKNKRKKKTKQEKKRM